jgi:hypothetical protein
LTPPYNREIARLCEASSLASEIPALDLGRFLLLRGANSSPFESSVLGTVTFFAELWLLLLLYARSSFPALQNTKVSFGICGKPLVTKKVLLGECGVLFCSIFFLPLHRGQKQPLYADSQISVRTRWRAHSAQTRSHQDDCVGLQVLANPCERAIDRRTRWARMEAAVKQA